MRGLHVDFDLDGDDLLALAREEGALLLEEEAGRRADRVVRRRGREERHELCA